MTTNPNGGIPPRRVSITINKKRGRGRPRKNQNSKPTTKNKVALKFAENLHREFDRLKLDKGFVTESKRCPCCKQLLPNPYTQEWLGKQCNMTKATIVHYFQGNRIPSLPTVAKLAKALECSMDDLLNGIVLELFEELDYSFGS